MGSTGSPISRAVPYDCTQGICSMNCPQWCFIIFPPPPPSPFPPDSESSSSTLSPLVVAVIGISAGAFLLVTYYAVISNYRRRRSVRAPDASETEPNQNQTNQERRWETVAGEVEEAEAERLDEAAVKSIAILKLKGEVEGRTECAVCLGEFGEDERVRVLPKCRHAFHLPCIELWLKSQSNCPLCRANVVHPEGDGDPFQP